MANIDSLYRGRSVEEVSMLLAKALMLAKEKPQIGSHDLQNGLCIGSEEAYLILDWLADQSRAEFRVSNHWIRCGRTFVLNNPFPDLPDMAKKLKIGERRSFAIMQELEKRGLIRILPDFSFDRTQPMTTFEGLVKQMKRVAKKYRGRCEPRLLVRTLYIDFATAIRLAQYGEEYLGLRWKDRPRKLR